MNSKVIQPLLNIFTPLRIKTFVFFDNKFENLIEVSTPIQLLIQKIGSYIENLILGIYEDELRGKSFDVIINVCEKIKFLRLAYINLENFSQLSRMILNFNNYLRYLTLEIKFDHNCLKTSSMILNELSKSLPLSLHYLDLNLVITNPDDLKAFFEKCNNQAELKTLLIRNRDMNSVVAILKVIRDFVKESNLEFLAYDIGNFFPSENESENESESLEKEIRSLIKMVNYSDLVIKVSDIDGNLMIS